MGIIDYLYRKYRTLPLVKSVLETHEASVKQLLIAQTVFRDTLLNSEKYKSPKHLAQFEHQVFSQNGEDGIVAEIFARIGSTNRVFVEIGVGDGTENNTAFLLSQGWSGLWIEGSSYFVKRIQEIYPHTLSSSQLKLEGAFVDASNVNQLLSRHSLPEEIDLLSLDIDFNTYWVWKALKACNPRVVIVEYNATMPPSYDWKVEYNAQKVWDGSFWFGASLKAFELLGKEHGFSLIACDLTGTNAFFVRSDLTKGHFLEPFTSEVHYEPARYYLNRTVGHPRPTKSFENSKAQ